MTENILKNGIKFDNLKIRYDLIPPLALNLLAQLYTKGAWKYEANNWKKGLKYSRCYGALQRHANAFWGGEWLDEQTLLPHLTCVMFCCCSIIEFHLNGQSEFDDRPVPAPMLFEFDQKNYEDFKRQLKEQDDACQTKKETET